ncbi:MAG: hypothetical protein Q8N83_11865 [Ignavibacteria bacterium]|nr:hypothetical protein [Ignavibacteria bacterium]
MAEYLSICSRCGCENPIFQSVCKKCGSITRDRVPNIDFWKIVGRIIESPKDAFIEIIQAEQKNYASFVLTASLFKIFLLVSLIVGVFGGNSFSLLSFGYFLLICVLVIIITGYIIKKVLVREKKKEKVFRIKDFYAVFSYSLVPQLMGLIILFALEFIVFGEQMFTFNPSPFLIKKNFAYLFLALELGIIVWNIFMTKMVFSIFFIKKLPPYIFSIIILSFIYFLVIIFM